MLNFIQTLTDAQKRTVLLVLHALLVPAAVLFALSVVEAPARSGAAFVEYLQVLPWMMCIAALCAYALRLTDLPLRDSGGGDVGTIAVQSLALCVASLVLSSILSVAAASSVHVVFGLAYFLFALVARSALLRFVIHLYRRSEERCRVVIYGAGATGTQLALALEGHKTIEPVAFVDDNATIQGIRVARLPVYAPSRMAELVRERQVRRVLLATPSMQQPKKAKLIARFQGMGLDVQALPSFAPLIGEAPLLEKLTPASAGMFLGRDEVSANGGAARGSYEGRAVMVIGAGGSIGAELCRQVLDLRPAKLILFELSEVALYTINLELQALAEPLPVEIVSVLGSVTEPRLVRRVMQTHGVQIVIHAAAYKHVPIVEENPLAGLVNNVLGTQTLVQQSIHAKIERFILISSDKAVRPANVMGASKRLAEAVVHNAGQQTLRSGVPIFATVRFGNVLGSSGSVVPLFQEQIGRGGPVTVTDPQMMRYFMTVQEAVRLVLESGSMARGGEVFVLDMGAPVSILQLARQVIENAGLTVRDDACPQGDIDIVITGRRRGEKMVEELTLSDELEATAHAKIYCSVEPKIPEQQTAVALRRLREAFVACDEELARSVAMNFVEPSRDEAPAGRDAQIRA